MIKNLLVLKIINIFLLCFIPQEIISQSDYLQTYDDYILVKTSIVNRSLNLNISPRENGTTKYLKRLWYRPNVRSTVGLGVRFKGLGVSYSFKAIKDPLINDITEESKYTDIRVNSLGKKIGYDINYQDYQGYFKSNFDINGFQNLFSSIRNLGRQDSVFTRNDLRLRNYSANIYYIFRPERFSYRAAFVFDERQLYSGGSFILTSSIGLLKINADSTITFDGTGIDFHPSVSYSDMNSFTFSVIPGYAYNLIFKEKFYASMGASALIGFMFLNGKTSTSENTRASYFLKGIIRSSLGYHADSWILGMAFTGDFQGINTKYAQYRTSIFELSVFVAHRLLINWRKGKKTLFDINKRSNKN